ncbi:hypothetical protein MXD59_23260 [Frankia sp. Ag45/Mut15]|uniref:Trypsin-co-occurring domain-containing protein n=1 Tax=Frankia umida TaxID=573489 RepID=A0ABT0K4K1_9ACTN|nr:trypco2 family protein [Frankia umida]MCK9878647.1 hypothetical protein [Frankia umida]
MDEVGLAEAIEALRRELAAAKLAGVGEPVQFTLGPVEMEFGLEIRRERKGEAGVKFWVLSVGGGGSAGRTATHRLKVTLQPQEIVSDGAGGTATRDMRVRDRDSN